MHEDRKYSDDQGQRKGVMGSFSEERCTSLETDGGDDGRTLQIYPMP